MFRFSQSGEPSHQNSISNENPIRRLDGFLVFVRREREESISIQKSLSNRPRFVWLAFGIKSLDFKSPLQEGKKNVHFSLSRSVSMGLGALLSCRIFW